MDDIFHYKERVRIPTGAQELAFSVPSFVLKDYVNFKVGILYSSPIWLMLKDSNSKVECINPFLLLASINVKLVDYNYEEHKLS